MALVIKKLLLVVKVDKSGDGRGESVKSIVGDDDWMFENSACSSVKIEIARVSSAGPDGAQTSEQPPPPVGTGQKQIGA